MVELADTQDLGSCAERHTGSTPVVGTIEVEVKSSSIRHPIRDKTKLTAANNLHLNKGL